MKSHNITHLEHDGFVLKLTIKDYGTVAINFEDIKDFFPSYPQLKDPKEFAKAKIDGGVLWFPPDIHVEPEYLMEIAQEQRYQIGASFAERLSQKYRVKS